MDTTIEPLTKREQEVLAHLIEGGRVATVAKALFISPHTVRNHLRSIFEKLGVHSQSELLKHVREQPRSLGNATPLRTPRTRESLIREYRQSHLTLSERVGKAWNLPPGAERLRAILHAALPLDAERAREWQSRLDLWCLASDSPDLAEIHGAQVKLRMDLIKEDIRKAQHEGWIQLDLDPEELAQTLHSLILSATIQLLQHPASQDAQLGIVDAYIERIIRD